MAKLAAWSSWAEFDSVYHQLVSTDAGERARGVQRVETWRSRSRLPVAVDVTASFVEIMLNDRHFNPATIAPRGDHELRLMYAMAVIRLVNGIVDVSQKNTSILSRAQDLEWPQWFVDLRHEASHQRLPALPLLRLAAQEALWLLVERFWRPQLAALGARGGHAAAQAAPGGTGKAPERTRGAKVLDRRLKALVQLAAAAGNAAPGARRKKRRRRRTSGAEDTVATANALDDEAFLAAAAAAAATGAEDAARDLAALAPDEGRLLARSLAVVASGEPSDDGREIRTLQLLCNSCSDNFAVRLARHVLCRALGLPQVELEAASDNSPSLRNISDSCGTRPEAAPAEHNFSQEAVSGESERMLRWLRALLKPIAEGPSSGGVLGTSLTSLLPLLRRHVVGRLGAASTSELAARAGRVWQELQSAGIDAGSDLFSLLCNSVEGAPMPDSATSAAKLSQSAEVSAEEAEAFLRKRKLHKGSTGSASARHEPWTALGTTLDPDTFAIGCRRELNEGPALAADAAQRWLEWAAEPTAEMHSLDVTAPDAEGTPEAPAPSEPSQPTQTEGNDPTEWDEEGKTTEDVPELPPLKVEPVAKAISEEEFRRLAAALVEQVTR